eukprot:Lithocolla_globosa_v1_NODE_2945_length_1815_cov_5.456250.p2 type:complete len:359 gc:universal NODE_2945_length_1815_cov_5.456250:560-1636(+)
MIEVGHNQAEALVEVSDEVLLWHDSVLVCDKGRASGTGVTRFDDFCLHGVAAGDKQQRKTTSSGFSGPDGGDEIIGVHATCDPFLSSIDDEVFAGSIEVCASAEICHIAACKRLADGKTDSFLATEHGRGDFLLHFRRSKLEHTRQTDGDSSVQSVFKTGGHSAGTLLLNDQFVEIVKLFRLHDTPHQAVWSPLEVRPRSLCHCNDAYSARLHPQLLGRGSVGLFTLESFGEDLLRKPLAHREAQVDVGFLEIGRLQTLQMTGITKGNHGNSAKELNVRGGGFSRTLNTSFAQARKFVENLKKQSERFGLPKKILKTRERGDTSKRCNPKKSSVASFPAYSSNNNSPPGCKDANLVTS